MRSVGPQTVTAGQPSTVHLTMTNEGRTPSGVLMLEDHVPYVLGTRPRFVLDGIGHGWRRHAVYQVRSDVRGRFEIGPMSVRVSDPFGLVELGRSFHSTATLTVTPRTVPLPPIPLGGAWTGSGDNRPRAFAIGSAEDVTVREYRRGDDLRRVHWRSSARVGELMVRREEQPWQSRATLFVDNRMSAHQGQGIASSLESAVSAAASIAVHLGQRGFTVRLVTASGDDLSTTWHTRDPELNTRSMLEALAVVQPVTSHRIDTGWLAESTHGGLLLAVIGAITEADGPMLRRMHHHAGIGAGPRPRRLGLGAVERRARRRPQLRPADAGPPGLARGDAASPRPARPGLAGPRPDQRPRRPVRSAATRCAPYPRGAR